MEKIENVEVLPLKNAKFVKPYRLNYSQNGVQKSWETVSVHPSVSIIIYNTDRKKLIFVKQFRPAVYFSHFPRHEREISPSSCLIGSISPTKSIATQSFNDQSTQHTQTAQHYQASQETQTGTRSHDGTATTGCVNQSTQSTQSTKLECSNQSTQSETAKLCHQSSQSDSLNSCEKKLLPYLPGSCGITLELCAGIVDKRAPLPDIAKEEVLEECGYSVSADSLEQVISYRSGVGMSGDLQTMFYVEVTDAMKVSQGGGLADEGELIEVTELSVEEARQLLKQKQVMAPSGLLFGVMWFLANKVDN